MSASAIMQALLAGGLTPAKAFTVINNQRAFAADTVSGLSGISGDLAICINTAINSSDPTAVTPSGFTNSVNVNGNDGTNFMRCMISYQKLTGALSSVTGMAVGSSHYALTVLILRPNFTIITPTVFNALGNVSAGIPTANTLTAASQSGAVVMVGAEQGNNGNPTVGGTISAGVLLDSPSSRFQGYYIIQDAASLANKTFTPDDSGTLNGGVSLGIACV